MQLIIGFDYLIKLVDLSFAWYSELEFIYSNKNDQADGFEVAG
jgi:hypothetical protein